MQCQLQPVVTHHEPFGYRAGWGGFHPLPPIWHLPHLFPTTTVFTQPFTWPCPAKMMPVTGKGQHLFFFFQFCFACFFLNPDHFAALAESTVRQSVESAKWGSHNQGWGGRTEAGGRQSVGTSRWGQAAALPPSTSALKCISCICLNLLFWMPPAHGCWQIIVSRSKWLNRDWEKALNLYKITTEETLWTGNTFCVICLVGPWYETDNPWRVLQHHQW